MKARTFIQRASHPQSPSDVTNEKRIALESTTTAMAPRLHHNLTQPFIAPTPPSQSNPTIQDGQHVLLPTALAQQLTQYTPAGILPSSPLMKKARKRAPNWSNEEQACLVSLRYFIRFFLSVIQFLLCKLKCFSALDSTNTLKTFSSFT